MKTTAIGLFLLFCTAAGLGQTCPGSNDPWYSLGCYAQGMIGSHPVTTLNDAYGTAGAHTIFSASGRAAMAVSGMIINVDTSIEPELIAGTSKP